MTEPKKDDFIDGIYNYCDRWCERCALASRCRVHAMEEEAMGSTESRDPNSAAFWQSLQGIFTTTIKMIREAAREHGIDLDAVESESERQRTDELRQRTHSHPLVKAGHGYARRVDGWFQSERGRFQQKEDQLNQQVRLGMAEEIDPEDEIVRITDAVEVIRWYQHQIPVKLARALSGQWEGDASLQEYTSRDSDGSAKVALLAIDRSLTAWAMLRSALPDQPDTVLDLLVDLDRLRRSTEQIFPQARSFVRPGFDIPA